MFKQVTKLLGAIAVTGWMGVANATLIFDFSWDSADGQIIGVIEGLEDVPGTQSARSVTLISANNVSLNIDYADRPYFNAFSVIDGELSQVEFYGFWELSGGRLTELLMCTGQCTGGSAIWGVRGPTAQFYDDWYSDRYRFAITTPVYTNRATVPEPSTVILLSLGLAGLSLVRYRKLS